ncbi:MAG: aldehyde dehydrogenase family protein [Deltaproteobacteria bacterium]|nr:aldehyde dehydrogenase family protein [Deltaproteobacteria bacterium]MBI3389403.1 aldehyde dehydrogenase family protein [Deltaproteobacteria bacterium]
MSAPVFDKVLIGGEWVAAANGTYQITNPATEAPAGFAPECSVAQVQAAAHAARDAFERGPWRTMSGAERGALLFKAAEKFKAEMAGLVDLTIAETGALKPVAVSQQVGAVPLRLAKNAELATAPIEEALAPRDLAGRGIAAGLVVREPIGVVACITPFNFPMTNCAGKIGPALACGNTVVVKPSPVDPLGVAELCRIVDSVLPPGVVNFVSGSGADIGEALTTSPDVDMISFTGSTVVGRMIQASAAARFKRTLMELGGKSANIIFADADQAKALASAMQVWTFHSGQICIAGTRVLIEQSIYDEFTKKLAAAGTTLKIGDPNEPGVVVGPLVSATQRERVERCIATGIAEGATLACGGKRPVHLPRGYYVEPTLFTQVRNIMTIAREEIFGPVITAIPFRDEADAIAIANDSEYGLYGYVWTGDSARGLRVARQLRTGTVQINGSGMNPDAPFGGYKQSGIGRDGGRYALNTYSELKYIGYTAA